jgi:hypothetical protein
MPKTRKFAELSRKVVADPERAQRVAAMEAAIEHALLLGEIREHRSLSQNDVAEVLGASQARVSSSRTRVTCTSRRYEQRSRSPSTMSTRRLLPRLGGPSP